MNLPSPTPHGLRRGRRLSVYAACACAMILAPAAVAFAGQPVQLVPPDPAAEDLFGQSVAIDGGWLVCGAPGRAGPDGPQCGAAYVYRREGRDWLPDATLTAAAPAAGGRAGQAVGISGETLAVASPSLDDRPGVVHLFGREDGAWALRSELTAAASTPDDAFGFSLSLAGGCLAVGAYRDHAAGTAAGAVYVFERDGGSWVERPLEPVPGLAENDYMGYAVATDGEWLAAGAWRDGAGGTKAGAVHLFHRDPAGWGYAGKLTAPSPAVNDRFGSAVAIAGGRLAVASPGAGDAGAVDVYELGAGTWPHEARLTGESAADGDDFGASLAFDGEDLVVGAPRDDDGGGDGGAAYVFTRDGGAWREAGKLIADGPERGLGASVAVDDGLVLAGTPEAYRQGWKNAGGACLAPAGTRTVRLPGAAGDFHDPNAWSAGPPAAGLHARIDDADVALAGPAEAGTVEVGPGGRLLADANASLALTGGLTVADGEPARVDLAEAGLRFLGDGPHVLEAQALQIGRLIVEDGVLAPAAPGGGLAAVAGELALGPGATVDLAGGTLAFGDGPLHTLLPGDTDLDGDVDAADLAVLRAHFDNGPAGWTAGDLDGDGAVGPADYLLLKRSLGRTPPPPLLPEPTAAVAFALAAAAAALRRRRRDGRRPGSRGRQEGRAAAWRRR